MSKISLLAVGDLVFSLPVQIIRHVLDSPRIFPLPRLNQSFLGVLLYRELPVPVINPERLWPIPPGREGPWPLALLFQVEQGDVALPVDRIIHIVDEDCGSWSEADCGSDEQGGRIFQYQKNRYPLLQIGALLQQDVPKA